MRSILVVLPVVPVPARSGGALRSLRLLQALDAAFDVTAIVPAASEAEADRLRAVVRGTVLRGHDRSRSATLAAIGRYALGLPAGYARYSGNGLRAALERALRARRYDAVHFDHLHTASLMPVVRRLQPETPVVIDEHNVESMLLRRLSTTHPSPFTRRLLAWHATRVGWLESILVGAADAVLACSQDDAAELRRLGASAVQVVPNGVDLAPPPEAEGPRTDVVFVGAMDWEPNVRAAIELVTRVWPAVSARLPGARLVFVGREPCRRVRALAGPTVLVTGTVPDVRPWLARAFATAIPLRAGGGTRLKVLEAASAGVPIVATALAVEGLPVTPGKDYLRAETPREFVDALLRVHDDAALRAGLTASAARSAQSLGWGSIGAALVRSYRALPRARPGVAPGWLLPAPA